MSTIDEGFLYTRAHTCVCVYIYIFFFIRYEKMRINYDGNTFTV